MVWVAPFVLTIGRSISKIRDWSYYTPVMTQLLKFFFRIFWVLFFDFCRGGGQVLGPRFNWPEKGKLDLRPFWRPCFGKFISWSLSQHRSTIESPSLQVRILQVRYTVLMYSSSTSNLDRIPETVSANSRLQFHNLFYEKFFLKKNKKNYYYFLKKYFLRIQVSKPGAWFDQMVETAPGF